MANTMRYIKIILVCAVFAGCAGIPGKTREIAETGWILLEVRSPERRIALDRTKLDAEAYSLNFAVKEEKAAFGKGAANRYRTSCDWGDGNTIKMGPAAATMMAMLQEPQLAEADFFKYLEQAQRYGITKDGKLELYSGANNRTVMVFTKK